MALAFGVAAILSCGDGSTEQPAASPLSGAWTYTGSNLTFADVPVSCGIFADMTLSQSGATLSGTTPDGTVSCTIGGGAHENISIAGDVIANGQVNGSSAQFDFGSPDIHNSGTFSGDTISGRVSAHLALEGGMVTIVGQIIATKK